MTTAREIREALHKRYNPIVNGRPGEGYLCIEEARSGAGFNGNGGQCDFLAINTWESRGLTIIGHEIKVSYADWRKELAKPEKAELFSRFCKLWWIVVPVELWPKIEHEVPTNWGAMTLSDKGRLTEKQKPTPNRDPAPVPVWWWIGWMAQVDRQHKRSLPDLIAAQLKPERDRMREFMETETNRRAAAQDQAVLDRLAHLDEFEAATGLNLHHIGRWDLERIGKLITTIRKGRDLSIVADQMRKASEMLDGIVVNSDALEVTSSSSD